MRLYDLLFLGVLTGIFFGISSQRRADSPADWVVAGCLWSLCVLIAIPMAAYYVMTAMSPALQKVPMNPALHIIWLVIIGWMLVLAAVQLSHFAGDLRYRRQHHS